MDALSCAPPARVKPPAAPADDAGRSLLEKFLMRRRLMRSLSAGLRAKLLAGRGTAQDLERYVLSVRVLAGLL